MPPEAPITCANCGSSDASDIAQPRTPCPHCGSTARGFTIEALVQSGAQFAVKVRRKSVGVTGRKKWALSFEGWQMHRESNEPRYVKREVDRKNDRYTEVVKALNGEVLRTRDEPLSQHKGHGHAKRKQND